MRKDAVTASLALMITLCAISLLTGSPTMAQNSAHVTVDAGKPLAKITTLSIGVNTAVWDDHLIDTAVPARIRQTGATVLRYPGGSTSDVYHWKTHTDIKHAQFKPSNDFDHFIAIARRVGATPIVTVNYGSNPEGTGPGEPSEAAAWVDYSNNAKHYGVRYWEIGNEIYGNGFYSGSGWEEDLHAPKTDPKARQKDSRLSPTAYGTNVNAFVAAMKAKDPRIKIGVVLTAPGAWPDGVDPDWNTNVLNVCGRHIDFAIVHLYPQNPPHESDSGLLASTKLIGGTVSRLKPVLKQYCGRSVPIFVTETDSVSFDPGKQSVSLVNGLFAADDILSWLDSGVANVDWWDLHNGPTLGKNNSPALYGSANYGDYGLLTNGQSPESPANTPHPSFYGLEMIHRVARPGDQLVAATSDNPLLRVHAARRAGGGLGVMLINQSPSQSFTVQVSTGKARLGSRGTRLNYDSSGAIKSTSLVRLGKTFTVTVPAYTITDVLLAK